MNLLKRASVAALLHDLDARSPAGCAIGLHIRFTTPLYMFQSYPKRWMDQYAGRGLLVVDPTVHWGMNNVGSVRWRDLESIDTHGVLDRARDFGIMNGVTIALLLDGTPEQALAKQGPVLLRLQWADQEHRLWLQQLFDSLHREPRLLDRKSVV